MSEPYSTNLIWSWDGFEEEKLTIKRFARRVVKYDLRVREQFASSIATGLICEAMRNPLRARTPDIRKAAEAQNELFRLHDILVNTHHLEFDFVRREWATILDPSPEEAARCKKLAKEKKGVDARV